MKEIEEKTAAPARASGEQPRPASFEAVGRRLRAIAVRPRHGPGWGRRSLLWRVVVDLAAHDAPGLAAELAYGSFLALVPALIFFAALFSFLAPAIGGPNVRFELERTLRQSLPPDLARIVLPYLNGLLRRRQSATLALGTGLSLWTVSSVYMTVMKAAARITHQQEQRSYLWRRGHALLLATYVPLLLLGSLALIAYGQALGGAGLSRGGLRLVEAGLQLAANLALASLASYLLLRAAHPRRPPQRALLAGTAVLVAGYWLAGGVFTTYAARVGHYRSTYGLLGSALAALIWFYISGFVILIGLEATALVANRRVP